MKRAVTWSLVVLIVMAMWLVLRDRGEPARPHGPSASPRTAAGTAPPADVVAPAPARSEPASPKELMPLASECIDQAKARNPGLRGRLVFSMILAPTENGRAIVASLKLRHDNEIEDPELIECIRESSFALEGLKAPHDFDITMPIGMDG